MSLPIKSVRQSYLPPEDILKLLNTFKRMVNTCIDIGIESDISSMKRLSLLSYKQLAAYDCPSYYKLCAISRAAGILNAWKKSIKRGYDARDPHATKLQLFSCYGFRVERGFLRIPFSRGRFLRIKLTSHTLSVLSEKNVEVRSFVVTPSSLSLTIRKEVNDLQCTNTLGVDRNLRNLTYGNEERIVKHDLSEAVMIANNTRKIVGSFKRDDARIRRRIAAKYGRRRKSRTNHLLHFATRQIVTDALNHTEAVVLEDIRGIRNLYRMGNGQGTSHRAVMNAWSFAEAQRQIEYKARWVGLPVIRLTKQETRSTSITCPTCGERLQSDRYLKRKLLCGKCRCLMDRDAVAAVNIARRGRVRFARSQSTAQAKGGSVEAVMGNPTPTVIPRVDAPKPAFERKVEQNHPIVTQQTFL